MAHLESTRIGWDGEVLAKYLLGQFCFISEPHKSSNDIGIDYTCTVFKKDGSDKRNKTVNLVPQDTFYIQIKSLKKKTTKALKNATVGLHKHIEFIEKLQHPYFLGILDKSTRTLKIYSGELIPYFLTVYGSENHTKIDIVLKENYDRDSIRRIETQSETIDFFKVLELNINDNFDEKDIKSKLEKFIHKVKEIQDNIVAYHQKLYVYTDTLNKTIQRYYGDNMLAVDDKIMLRYIITLTDVLSHELMKNTNFNVFTESHPYINGFYEFITNFSTTLDGKKGLHHKMAIYTIEKFRENYDQNKNNKNSGRGEETDI